MRGRGEWEESKVRERGREGERVKTVSEMKEGRSRGSEDK